MLKYIEQYFTVNLAMDGNGSDSHSFRTPAAPINMTTPLGFNYNEIISGSIADMIEACNLVNIHMLHHGEAPPTHKHGSRLIDVMFISQRLVENVEACGILPFDKIFVSDHRPLYVDFNVYTLFGNPAFVTEKEALRTLQLHNPRLIDAYEESTCQQLVNHNVEFRVTVLFQLKEQQWTNDAESIFNKIDRDIKRAIQCVANKCRCTNHKKHPWSEQFRTVTCYIIYWRQRMDIVRLKRSANDTKIFYMIQAVYPKNTNHDEAPEIQCQTEIRKGKAMMNTELERQKGLTITKRRSLSESVVAKRHPTISDKDYLSSTLR
jgi:hypothetical protein